MPIYGFPKTTYCCTWNTLCDAVHHTRPSNRSWLEWSVWPPSANWFIRPERQIYRVPTALTQISVELSCCEMKRSRTPRARAHTPNYAIYATHTTWPWNFRLLIHWWRAIASNFESIALQLSTVYRWTIFIFFRIKNQHATAAHTTYVAPPMWELWFRWNIEWDARHTTSSCLPLFSCCCCLLCGFVLSLLLVNSRNRVQWFSNSCLYFIHNTLPLVDRQRRRQVDLYEWWMVMLIGL